MAPNPRPGPPSPPDWWWVFDPRVSVRAQAALLIGGGGILFTLLLSWLAATLFQRHLESGLGPTLETFATQVSDKIDRQIYERSRELQFAATLAAMRDPATGNVERRRILESLLDASIEFAWL